MILIPVRRELWSPSQRSAIYGIEDKQTWFVRARLHDGHIVWRGRFDDRDECDAFLFALFRGSLRIERELWRLPTPHWHPGVLPAVYDCLSSLAVTSQAGQWRQVNKPVDFNDNQNNVEAIGSGGGAYSPNGLNGAGGGAYSKSSNVAWHAQGYWYVFVGGPFGTSRYTAVSATAGTPYTLMAASGRHSNDTGVGGDKALGTGTVKNSGGNGAAGVNAGGNDYPGGGGGAAGANGDGGDGSAGDNANNHSGAGGGGNGGGDATDYTHGAGAAGGGNGGDGGYGSTEPVSPTAGTNLLDGVRGSGGGGSGAKPGTTNAGADAALFGGGAAGKEASGNASHGMQGIVLFTWGVTTMGAGNMPMLGF